MLVDNIIELSINWTLRRDKTDNPWIPMDIMT